MVNQLTRVAHCPRGPYMPKRIKRAGASLYVLLRGQLIVNPRQSVKWGYTEIHPLFKRNRYLPPDDCCSMQGSGWSDLPVFEEKPKIQILILSLLNFKCWLNKTENTV